MATGLCRAASLAGPHRNARCDASGAISLGMHHESLGSTCDTMGYIHSGPPLMTPASGQFSSSRMSASPQPKPRLSRRTVPRRAMIAFLSIPALARAAPALSQLLASSESSSSVSRNYDAYAPSYNTLDGATAAIPSALGFPALRAAAVGMVSGRVLEVGCGTGANFPLYQQAHRVRDVTAVDVSQGMLYQANRVREGLSGVDIELALGDVVDGLPFSDGEFDSVLDTFSLCVMGNPLAALSEMRRVLSTAPGARAVLAEHTVSSLKPISMYQNVTAGLVAKTSKGCYWNQDVLRLAEMAGFRVVSKQYMLAGTVVLLELCRSDASRGV